MRAPLTEQGAESREKIKKDIWARRAVAGQPRAEGEENAKNTPGFFPLREREKKECMIGLSTITTFLLLLQAVPPLPFRK